MYLYFQKNKILEYSFTEEELIIVLGGFYSTLPTLNASSVEAYAYLSHIYSVRIIPLLYKNYLGRWKDIFQIAPFPDRYKKYEQDILSSKSLFYGYGNMLWTANFFDSLGHILPDYLYQELDSYRFGAAQSIIYANPFDRARFSGCVYMREF